MEGPLARLIEEGIEKQATSGGGAFSAVAEGQKGHEGFFKFTRKRRKNVVLTWGRWGKAVRWVGPCGIHGG